MPGSPAKVAGDWTTTSGTNQRSRPLSVFGRGTARSRSMTERAELTGSQVRMTVTRSKSLRPGRNSSLNAEPYR